MDVGRYFVDDDELIHRDNHTYVLSKMWGTQSLQYIRDLCEMCPQHRISFKVEA